MEAEDRELSGLLWDALPPDAREAWQDIVRLAGPDDRRRQMLSFARQLDTLAHDMAVGRDDEALARSMKRRGRLQLPSR